MNQYQLTVIPDVKSSSNQYELQLSPIKLNDSYAEEWHEGCQDFVVLTRGGNLVNNSLYRVGGLGKPDLKAKYFMLLKYTEAYYSKEIMKMSKSKDNKHLQGDWCIVDSNGVEKVIFKSCLDHGYIVDNSCIYSVGSNYYNIETKELYAYASTSMESTEFLFLDTKYEKNKDRRGIMKIHKYSGSWELIK